MKKILVILLIAAALAGLSCQSAPASNPAREVTQENIVETRPPVVEEAPQEKVTETPSQTRGGLDLTGAREYTVKRGDTLSDITRECYGNLSDVGNAGSHNGFYFPVIMLASDGRIADPDVIEPGINLTIVDLKRNLANAGTRKAIKDCLMDMAGVYSKKGRRADEQGLIALSNSL